MRSPIIAWTHELVERLNLRTKWSRSTITVPTVVATDTAQADNAQASFSDIATRTVGRCRLRVSLRIDESSLMLDCGPSIGTAVLLRWESGGFVFGMLIGGDELVMGSGAVTGVEVVMDDNWEIESKSDKCLSAGASDLTISVTYKPSEAPVQNGLSIILDTSGSARFNMKQLHHWLAFWAIWIESQPQMDVTQDSGFATTPATGPSNPWISRKVAIAVLVRFRHIDFQSSFGNFEALARINSVVLRTLANGETTQLSLSLNQLDITLDKGLKGSISSRDFSFETLRRSSRSSSLNISTLLRLSLRIGDLKIDILGTETYAFRCQQVDHFG